MRIIKPTFLLFALALVMSAFTLASKTVKIQTNAVCEMCKDRIETAIGALDGVESVRLDLTTKKVKISYDDKKQSEASLRMAITKIGYSAEELPADAEAQAALPGCCKAPEDGGKGCHDDKKG